MHMLDFVHSQLIKFLSSTGMGGIQLSASITSCMWACTDLYAQYAIPSTHLTSKNLEENTPKEGVQLTMAPMPDGPDAMPEVAAVMYPVAMPSFKVLLSEEDQRFKQDACQSGGIC
eukprot:symbB.v1.2.026013.t1/scaffold2529.1/size77954/1